MSRLPFYPQNVGLGLGYAPKRRQNAMFQGARQFRTDYLYTLLENGATTWTPTGISQGFFACLLVSDSITTAKYGPKRNSFEHEASVFMLKPGDCLLTEVSVVRIHHRELVSRAAGHSQGMTGGF